MIQNSSFIISPYRRKYLKEYYLRMSKDDLNVLWDDNVASVLEEQGFSIEQAPRSVYKVEKLYEALMKYAPNKAPVVRLDDEHIQNGIKFAYACFGRGGRSKLSALDLSPKVVYDITSNLQGSAGLTAWGQTKAESYVRAYHRGRQTLLSEKAPEPCIAFKRTQFNDKTRLVWGYPYSMTAVEGLVARPLIDSFLSSDSIMSFGTSVLELGSKLRINSYSHEWAYSTDISSFDSSIPAQLIHLSFNVLRTWFNMSDIVDVGTGRVSVGDIFNQIENYFIYTPIVMPDGNLYKGKRHGVPSGSYFTQMIDSIVNAIVVGTISSKFRMHVSKSSVHVLGDDVIFWSNRNLSLKVIADYASSTFGMSFNKEKSGKFHFDEPIRYLGRDWHDGVPDLPESEILKRMAQPETFRKYSKDPDAREREVRLLLMSYAAVYKTGYRIYMQAVHKDNLRYNFSPTYHELNDIRLPKGSGYGSIDPNHLTGLQRYMMKYFSEHKKGFTPIGIRCLA